MIEVNEQYMRLAIATAKETKEGGGVAIGAVLVRESDGHIIAKGGSLVGVTKDPTAHAEINCIREASNKLESDDLYDYTLYCTLEPCHMCLSAAAWARIPRIFFGAYRKDVDPSLFDIEGSFSDEQEAAHMNLRENTTMHVQGGALEQDCAVLLDGYHDFAKHTEGNTHGHIS
jgi:guanine deaminase